MQEFNIEKHPAIIHAVDMAEITKPLLQYGIIYFAYIQIAQGRFGSGLTNQRAWAELYLTKKYYHDDVFSNQVFKLAKDSYYYLMWDNISKKGRVDELYQDVWNLGFSHLFSIIEDNGKYQNCYYFGSGLNNENANNFYINNLDVLHAFIQYFKDVVKSNKILKKALSTNIILPGYAPLKEENMFSKHMLRKTLPTSKLKRYIIGNINNGIWLTSRELDYVRRLRLGKNMKEIALLENVSKRTVEEAITNIKEKLDCSTMFQLGEQIALLGIEDYFQSNI